MKGTNPFGFGFPASLANGFDNDQEDEDMFENYYSNDWSLPKNILEETGIFAREDNRPYPLFYFDDELEEVNQPTPPILQNRHSNAAVSLANVEEEVTPKVQGAISVEKVKDSQANITGEPSAVYQSAEKTEECTSRRDSTENYDSLSESKGKDEGIHDQKEDISAVAKDGDSPRNAESESKALPKSSKNSDSEDKEDQLRSEEDPDFCYKAPRKQRFEYNKRKDVILKTILRKCRRVLQDQFNEMTEYFQSRKMQGHQFLKDCVVKFHDSIPNKPEGLDLVFYLCAILYPQEMNRGVDCFFEADKKDRVKQRKFYRAKIQRVHDVLYRYSHEKMDYFVKVPELSYLYTLFYKKETEEVSEDQYYLNGATEIFEKCKETLLNANISI